ncbi:MAG: GerAB/ArcD/ProY family transporter [Prevotella sp.]|nr:GerAB/ArcD/ProY family transporter [Prevotella sp.]
MEQKKYIGWGQLLLLLFMCRAFTLMTFVPFAREGEGLSLRLTAAAISTAVQAVLLIPAVLLKRSSTSVITEKNKFCGAVIDALYLAFFLFYTANSLLHFQSFLSARFFPYADALLWIGVILIVCVYCARLGTEALGRSAVLLFWVFAVALAAMAISSAGEISSANLYFEPLKGDGLFSAVMDDLSRSGEICAAVFLAGRVRDKLRCGLYGLLSAKLVLAAAVTLLIAAVLGDFAVLTDYPFLALGTFGGERFIQRADSLYLVVWTVTAVINASLFLHVSAELFGEIFPRMRFGTSVSAVLTFGILAAVTVAGSSLDELYGTVCSGWAVIILTGIIPLAALIVSRAKKVPVGKGEKSEV